LALVVPDGFPECLCVGTWVSCGGLGGHFAII
jgi:hypothetical protein